MFLAPTVVSRKFELQLNVKRKGEVDINRVQYDVTLIRSFLSGSKDFNLCRHVILSHILDIALKHISSLFCFFNKCIELLGLKEFQYSIFFSSIVICQLLFL